MLKRIEEGSTKVSIGSVFEVATILGIPLISEDKDQLQRMLKQTEQTLSLLPKTAPKRAKVVKDDL